MKSENNETKFRIGAITGLIGAVSMLIGAALWGSSGTDLWLALESGHVEGYLTAAGGLKGQLIANLSIWIFGTFIFGIAGIIMAGLSDQKPFYSLIADYSYKVAVPMVIISYVAMLAVVVQIAPDTSPMSIATAKAVGWIGVRIDDIATLLMLGLGPLFISLSGKSHWVPGWLLVWSYVAAFLGVISIVVLYFPGLGQYGFMVIPLGLGWMIAASIVLFKRAKQQQG